MIKTKVIKISNSKYAVTNNEAEIEKQINAFLIENQVNDVMAIDLALDKTDFSTSIYVTIVYKE